MEVSDTSIEKVKTLLEEKREVSELALQAVIATGESSNCVIIEDTTIRAICKQFFAEKIPPKTVRLTPIESPNPIQDGIGSSAGGIVISKPAEGTEIKAIIK